MNGLLRHLSGKNLERITPTRKPFLFLALLTLSFFIVLTVPATVAAAEEAVLDAKVAICKDLKPFNNLDELLYQFYINLDSDCLFKMPTAELEEKWGIKILSEERAIKLYEELEKKTYSGAVGALVGVRSLLRNSPDFENKPYISEKDAFYLESVRGLENKKAFWISITKVFFDRHVTLFPGGNFPKMLPKPSVTPYSLKIDVPGLPPASFKKPEIMGEYRMDTHRYYWLNPEKTRMITLHNSGGYGVERIIASDYVLPSMIMIMKR